MPTWHMPYANLHQTQLCTPPCAHLHNGQHQQEHGGSTQHAFVANNLERRNGQVGHEEVFKRNLRRLDALAATQHHSADATADQKHMQGHHLGAGSV
jgi:hypothetical protein